MSIKIKAYLKSLVDEEISYFEDNIYRASHQSTLQDDSMQYGESGKTLNEIIQKYKDELDTAKLALDYLESLNE